MTMKLNTSHYGPLLMPLISERLQNFVQLIVTHLLGKDNWNITDFINCIKKEVDASESCDFIKNHTD